MSFNNPFGASAADEEHAGLGYNGSVVSLNYFTGLPDPNLIGNTQLKLIFKSLMKQNDTTKEKALNELIGYLQQDENVDEFKDTMVLITWTQIYPKISISESKSVRFLAHQFQCNLVQRLQKSYGKYLKDSVPILLSGVFDFDSIVSNSTTKSINNLFNNNPDKLKNLWTNFQSEILNLAKEVFNNETVDSLSDERYVPKDQAETKYLRILNSVVLMINYLVQNCSNEDKFTALIEDYQNFFEYENLWHYLLVNSNLNNQKIYKSILQLMNNAIKVDNLLTAKAWKLMSKRFLKSLTFVSKVDLNNKANLVVYSSLVLPILISLINLNEINPDFYSYDKTAHEKVVNFLRIGSLNSNAVYYSYLEKYLSNCKIFDFNTDGEIFNILLHNFEIEAERNSKLRNQQEFIEKSLQIYLIFVNKFQHFEKNEFVLVKLLSLKSLNADKLIELSISLVPSEYLNKFLNKYFEKIDDLGHYEQTQLIQFAELSSQPLDNLLSQSMEKLSVEESNEVISNHYIFSVFEFILKNDLAEYKEQVDEFILELPSFISEEFIDIPIKLLISYSNCEALFNEETFIESVDGFILKLELIGKIDLFMNQINKFKHDLFKSEEFKRVIDYQVSNYEFDNDYLFNESIVNNALLGKLYEKSMVLNKLDVFVVSLLKYNSNNVKLVREFLSSSDFLKNIKIWEVFNINLHELIVKNLIEEEAFALNYFNGLKEFIFINTVDSTAEQILNFLKTLSKETISTYLISDSLVSEVLGIYGEVIDSRLALGNALETSVYLLPNKDGVFNLQVLKYLKFSKFLSLLGSEEYQDVLKLSLLNEICKDYEFLTNVDISFETKINGYFDSDLLVKLLNGYEFELTSSGGIAECFLKNRVLKNVLSSKDYNIEASDINEFMLKNIRKLKTPQEIIKFIAIISSIPDDLYKDEIFSRFKNLICSEFIGMKNDEILTNGLKNLNILNIVISSDLEEFPLQEHRFNMFVNEVNKWFEYEVAFEEEFLIIRVELLKLFGKFVTCDIERTDLFNELCGKMYQESIDFVKLGDGEDEEQQHIVELKYFTLKFYNVLVRQGYQFDDLKETEQDLIEVFVRGLDARETNQPIVLTFDILVRIIKKIKISKLEPFYKEILHSFIGMDVELQRGLMQLLIDLITETQQEAVIEFEISKEFKPEFNIDSKLVESVDFGLVEYDSQSLQNLWMVVLILVHFKDTTMKFKSELVSQLSEEFIRRLLELNSVFIEDCMSDKQFVKRLDEHSAVELDVQAGAEDTEHEIKLVSVHVYYLLLNLVTGVSVGWFNELKDVNFKRAVDGFTSEVISPSLIKSKMGRFSSKMGSLLAQYENLSLKTFGNEIKATYQIDDQSMEIVYRVPKNYPLSNIEIIGNQRVGVKEREWKAWILSAQRIISLQNGEIYESLEYFLKNVSLHFKGFEDCSICYSVLHGVDRTLADKCCATCKNKFHGGCLYKWFKSSGGSSCPLCRSNFRFD